MNRESVFQHPDPTLAWAVVSDINPVIKIGLIYTDGEVARDIAKRMQETTGQKHRAVTVSIAASSFW